MFSQAFPRFILPRTSSIFSRTAGYALAMLHLCALFALEKKAEKKSQTVRVLLPRTSLPTTAAARAKQEAMASETDHGEALAGAHARCNPHTTAIPLLIAPRACSVPGSP